MNDKINISKINISKVNIGGLNIDNVDYSKLASRISEAISNNSKLFISYANAHIINCTYKNTGLRDKINSFDLIHPDGIGIYLASKILYGSGGLQKRVSGSDFYPSLSELCTKNNYTVFFFGHDEKTLGLIKKNYPQLSIAGLQKGYDFDDESVLRAIDSAAPKIMVTGLGFPKQEEWVLKYRERLNCNVSICVGEGIRVFAGTKIRGPEFMRALGLEWFVRFLLHPIKYFNRYIIGNPLFLLRILLIKISNFK